MFYAILAIFQPYYGGCIYRNSVMFFSFISRDELAGLVKLIFIGLNLQYNSAFIGFLNMHMLHTLDKNKIPLM